MKKFKKLLSVVLVLAVAMTMSVVSFAASTIKITLDGKALASSPAPVNQGGHVLVPVRLVTENLGGVVDYNATAKVVSIVTADHTLKLIIGSDSAIVDGKSVDLDAPAVIIGSNTYVPTRFVAESIGANVTWDASSSTVKITYFSGLKGTIKNDGSTTIQPFAQASADALKKISPDLSIAISGGGSGVGITDVDAGTVDIGSDSSAWATSDATAHPTLVWSQVGNDAVAVIVNPSNPVKSLTQQNVKDIFMGKIVNWKDVGGPNAAILVNTREQGSGTLDCFSKKALGGGAVVSTAIPNDSNELMINAVKSNTNAIGFASLGYVANDTSVTSVTVDKIKCTVANAYAGLWWYTRPLIVLTKGAPTGNSAIFINFMRSRQGQDILQANNYLPLSDKYLK